MAINLGTTGTSKIYLGSTQIQKVYLGTTQLYTAFEVVINGTENTLTQSTSSSDQSVRGFTLRTDGYTYNYANTEIVGIIVVVGVILFFVKGSKKKTKSVVLPPDTDNRPPYA